MGSLTRKLRRTTTGLDRAAARRVAHNLDEYRQQQPLSDKLQAEMQARLEKLNAHERVNLVSGQLSATEIRRRLEMSAAEQFAQFGFAIRGGVSLLPEQPAAIVEAIGDQMHDDYASLLKAGELSESGH